MSVQWNLSKVDHWCDDHLVIDGRTWKFKNNLEECKTHCEIHGASILTYNTNTRGCVCCPDNTLFNAYLDEGSGNVYEKSGTVNILSYL